MDNIVSSKFKNPQKYLIDSENLNNQILFDMDAMEKSVGDSKIVSINASKINTTSISVMKESSRSILSDKTQKSTSKDETSQQMGEKAQPGEKELIIESEAPLPGIYSNYN